LSRKATLQCCVTIEKDSTHKTPYYVIIIVHQRKYNETFSDKMQAFLFEAVNGCFHSYFLISLHGPYRRVSFLLRVLDNSAIFKHFFPSESYVEFAYVVGEHKTQNMNDPNKGRI